MRNKEEEAWLSVYVCGFLSLQVSQGKKQGFQTVTDLCWR